MYILHVGALMYLNEATLLHNVRVRYARNQIYVSTCLQIKNNFSVMKCSHLLLCEWYVYCEHSCFLLVTVF